MAKELDPRRAALKREFIEARGFWADLLDDVLELSPEYFQAYTNYSSVPFKTGALSPKVREFVFIAIDAATTHLYNMGTRAHIVNALRHGATREELMEVLMITSFTGVHTMSEGVPVLIEVLKAAGQDPKLGERELDAKRVAIKEGFVAARGVWPAVFDPILHFAPAYIQAYAELSSAPIKLGALEPKVRELMAVAVNASSTTLYGPGIRAHMTNAVKHGATAEEIMEVLMLTSCVSAHTISESVPILIEELEKYEAAQARAAE
jgi:AhpD family alkylhydroperoxidase